jgi:hypothetical protein
MSRASRRKKPLNLNDAKFIGILYPLNNEQEYDRVSLFTKKLQDQGKKVNVIGLYEYNRIPVYYIPKLAYDLLHPKDLDIFFRPKAPFVSKFIEEEFDILIDLSLPSDFPLYYIASLSKASFKIGRMVEGKEMPYDLMIDAGPDIDSKQLIEQIVHYTNAFELKANHENDSTKPNN